MIFWDINSHLLPANKRETNIKNDKILLWQLSKMEKTFNPTEKIIATPNLHWFLIRTWNSKIWNSKWWIYLEKPITRQWDTDMTWARHSEKPKTSICIWWRFNFRFLNINAQCEEKKKMWKLHLMKTKE